MKILFSYFFLMFLILNPAKDSVIISLNKEVRLLGKTPHVPFATIKSDKVISAKQSDCIALVDTTEIWYNLGCNGAVVGESKISNSFFYDVTECHELNLRTIRGVDGVGLYTSENVDWELDSTWFWQPSLKDLDSLNSFYVSLDQIVSDSIVNSSPLKEEDCIFFKVSSIDKENNFEWGKRTNCVVFGKKFLAIAYLNKNNNWKLAHLENEYSNSEYRVFSPIALIDIGKDGLPEIIFENNLGHVFCDELIRLKNEDIGSWELVASSIGGGLL